MARDIFRPDRDIPSLKGKVVLVTGGNSGTGYATIRALAPHGPKVIYLCGRRHQACEDAAAELRKETGYQNIVVLDMDLASLKSVKTAANEFLSKENRLDLLFLNAGVSGTAYALTPDGYETQFGINHIGHALLAQILMPTLLSTQDAGNDVRVILTSSNAAFAPSFMLPGGGLGLADMFRPDAYQPIILYSHSKLANALFARKLAALYPSLSVTAVHPGVVNSPIFTKSNGGIVSTILRTAMRTQWVSIDEGAKTQLWCASQPRATDNKGTGVISGAFYNPVGKLVPYKGATAKQALVDELWEWTNEQLAKHGGTGWVNH